MAKELTCCSSSETLASASAALALRASSASSRHSFSAIFSEAKRSAVSTTLAVYAAVRLSLTCHACVSSAAMSRVSSRTLHTWDCACRRSRISSSAAPSFSLSPTIVSFCCSACELSSATVSVPWSSSDFSFWLSKAIVSFALSLEHRISPRAVLRSCLRRSLWRSSSPTWVLALFPSSARARSRATSSLSSLILASK